MKLILTTLLATAAVALGVPFAPTPGSAHDEEATPVASALAQWKARQGLCSPAGSSRDQVVCAALELEAGP